MSGYQTEQKRKLLTFLEQNAEVAYSIDEIIQGLSAENPREEIPGKSTVYRLMTKLVDEGEVKRFVKGNSRHFVYQLLRGKDCVGHLHLRCSSCGSLLHLDRATSDLLLSAVAGVKHFAVSKRDTVLLGTCADCLREGTV